MFCKKALLSNTLQFASPEVIYPRHVRMIPCYDICGYLSCNNAPSMLYYQFCLFAVLFHVVWSVFTPEKWKNCLVVTGDDLKGKWQQKILSSHLKETPKQYIEVLHRIFTSALFREIFSL
mgnify:CR=1 FL=1